MYTHSYIKRTTKTLIDAGAMISRQWKGVVETGNEQLYIDYLKQFTFPKLTKLSGFVNAQILHQTVEQGTEFLIITRWESLDDIRAFAGDVITTAVVPDEVQKLMVTFDRHVSHYEIEFELRQESYEQ